MQLVGNISGGQAWNAFCSWNVLSSGVQWIVLVTHRVTSTDIVHTSADELQSLYQVFQFNFKSFRKGAIFSSNVYRPDLWFTVVDVCVEFLSLLQNTLIPNLSPSFTILHQDLQGLPLSESFTCWCNIPNSVQGLRCVSLSVLFPFNFCLWVRTSHIHPSSFGLSYLTRLQTSS